MNADILKVFIPSTLSFAIGISLAFFLSHYLYKFKMWKKQAGKKDFEGKDTPIFNDLHRERETNVPKMGGILIWASPVITAIAIAIISGFSGLAESLSFLSRNQTWIPLSTLLLGGLVGLIDDYMEVVGSRDNIAGGLSLKKRLFIVSAVSLAVSFWFFFKLESHTIGIPFLGELDIGWLIIPLFLIVSLGIYSGGVIDGIDGLAGGIFAAIFASYGGIAFFQHQIDLAALCIAITGAILAFLWFNIPPARFYMSETGSMALTLTLTVIAFLSDSVEGASAVVALPIIAMPLVVTSLSNIIQIFSKKFLGRKVFLVAPLHHHFEAKGWPPYKVTMRYWVIGVVFAIIGLIFALI